jgi:hypothetical protein
MLAVAVLTGKPTDRYFLNVIYLGPFLAWPLLIAPSPSQPARRAVPSLVGAGALGLLLIASPSLPKVRALAAYGDYYPPLVACLDANAPRYGLRSGIAQYWQARPIEMLSRRNLQAVTIRPDLTPWHWLGSLDWYNRDIDFAVVDNSPLGDIFSARASTLAESFGPPATVFSCGDSDIYVYNRPGDTAFQEYLRQTALYTLLERPGRVITLGASELRGEVGTLNGPTRSTAPGQKGYLVLSNWLSLDEGAYLMRIDYAAHSERDPGFVEVSGQGASSELELTSPLPLHSGRRNADIHFALATSTQVQIQIYTNGSGQLGLEKIQLIRLK